MYGHRLEMAMAKADAAQITVRLSRKLAESFTEAIEAAFLRRDAWLSHILAAELPRIAKELEGHTNSPAAKKFIEARLADQERTTLTIALDRGTAETVRSMCDAHGVVRDALFSRLVVLLTLPPQSWAHEVGVPAGAVEAEAGALYSSASRQLVEHGPWLHYVDVYKKSALSLTADAIKDPFAFHRAVLDLLKSDSEFDLKEEARAYWKSQALWTLSFADPAQGVSRPDRASFDLVLSDAIVPGTSAWAEQQQLGQSALDEFKSKRPAKSS
jgi:hypothetical protein